jgi:hypothetical protein
VGNTFEPTDLRKVAFRQLAVLSIDSAATQVCAANSNRQRLLMGADITIAVDGSSGTVRIGRKIGAAVRSDFILSNGQPSLIVSVDDAADLVQSELWAVAQFGPTPLTVSEVAYVREGNERVESEPNESV